MPEPLNIIRLPDYWDVQCLTTLITALATRTDPTSKQLRDLVTVLRDQQQNHPVDQASMVLKQIFCEPVTKTVFADDTDTDIQLDITHEGITLNAYNDSAEDGVSGSKAWFWEDLLLGLDPELDDDEADDADPQDGLLLDSRRDPDEFDDTEFEDTPDLEDSDLEGDDGDIVCEHCGHVFSPSDTSASGLCPKCHKRVLIPIVCDRCNSFIHYYSPSTSDYYNEHFELKADGSCDEFSTSDQLDDIDEKELPESKSGFICRACVDILRSDSYTSDSEDADD